MRIRTNRIYPYPIFCCDSKDYENKHFESSVDIEYDMVDATVLLNLVIEDEMIQELIKQKKVAVNCMVDCSRTKYREVFEIGMDEQLHAEIVIPVERLNGLIEITCLLVTNVKIENVENDNFAGLYDNAVVSYPQYATIGYTETEELELNKHIDSSGEIPSIFKITRGADDSKEISYDATLGDSVLGIFNIIFFICKYPFRSIVIFHQCRKTYIYFFRIQHINNSIV